MARSSTGLTVVTGGSGYIAGYCIAELLRENWRVRMTLRDPAAAARVLADIATLGVDSSTVGCVGADLNSDDGWAEAMSGADYAIHLASPVPAVDPPSDQSIVAPARDGTLRVLRAARDAGVKRVVVTSSAAAAVYGRKVSGRPFTEADWTDVDNRADTAAHDRAKTIAERDAWNWLESEGGPLEMATILPSYVVGPIFSPNYSVTLDLIRRLLDGSIPALPRFGFTIVDVRDVARLHVLAMTAPQAAGQRFIGAGEYFWLAEIAATLRRGLGDQAKQVATLAVPDFMVRAVANFDPILRSRLFELGRERRLSSQKARTLLGWSTRPGEVTLLDAARSFYEQGVL